MYHSEGFAPMPRAAQAPGSALGAALERLGDALNAPGTQMRGLMLAVDGAVAGQRFWQPYQPEDKVWVYSVSKSFTATGIGFAADAGLLSPDDFILSFFPEDAPQNPSENLRAMRVRHLLSMTTGHGADTLYPVIGSAGQSWAGAFLAQPVPYPPGTHFVYNSGASYMLAAILRRVTGVSLLDWLAPRLFGPLGFDDVDWDQSPQGIETGGWGLKLRLEDQLKLGELYRCGGVYGGSRLLSEEWVAAATSPQAGTYHVDDEGPDWNQGYGFQFWMCRHGAFRADGAFGQFSIAMPQQKATLALMCETGDTPRALQTIWDTLLPALESHPHSQREGDISGREYALAPNPQKLTKAAFHLEDGRLRLSFEGPGGTHALCAGPDAYLEGETTLPLGASTMLPYFSQAGRPQKVSALYRWAAPGTLEVHWVWRETPHRDTLTCVFEKDGVRITCPPNAAALQAGAGPQTLLGAAPK